MPAAPRPATALLRPSRQTRRALLGGTSAALVAVLGLATAVPAAGTMASAASPAGAPDAAPVTHDLRFDADPRAATVSVGEKTYAGEGRTVTDKVFRDGFGREVLFRGWNVSGSTKLAESGFKPFRTAADADRGFAQMRELSGANVTRLLVAWEGVHPRVDTIDYTYLDAVARQVHAAASARVHVLLDYHQDLFSRYLFNPGSWHTGNGAPAWVTPPGDYPREFCGVICVTWGQHLLTDEAVRRAYRNFWNNKPFATSAGERRMQDEYLWQLRRALAYLKATLPAADWPYILGLDPMNEPADGGMDGLTPAQWDNERLWPFYRKVRQVMDAAGWGDKLAFAEPLVFWNSTVGFAAPATGGGHLVEKPGPGFVFNSHFYDGGRMSLDLRGVDNAAYLQHLDAVREEARFLGVPAFLSEFGMWRGGDGSKDTNRTIKAVYQGLELSDRMRDRKDRFADPYTPFVGSTEWQWDVYYGRHHEPQNGNPDKVMTEKDAWNGEDFSVVRADDAGRLACNIDCNNIQRAYPRRVQGDAMGFVYNDLSRDARGKLLDWAAVRAGDGAEHFRGNQFALLSWRGRRGSAPTELYLPRQFDPARTLVVTERRVDDGLAPATAPANRPDEVLLVRDTAAADAGHRLLVWDDPGAGEDAGTWHFALVVLKRPGETYRPDELAALQAALRRTIQTEHRSPVYLTGAMTPGGYPADRPLP